VVQVPTVSLDVAAVVVVITAEVQPVVVWQPVVVQAMWVE
jgi:hypothetical protein